MKTIKVKTIMVPVADYAVVQEFASLAEALIALENEHKSHNGGPYRHQSLVVVDANQRVVGRISQIDIMRALEPKYKEIGDSRKFGLSGLTSKMLVTIRESFSLYEWPIETIPDVIAAINVADFMQVPTEGEFVEETDTLNIAMHRIVMGQHHSLLVTKEKRIVGILRSTDVFNALYNLIEPILPDV
jgi:CBS-domain-containing membrane protein